MPHHRLLAFGLAVPGSEPASRGRQTARRTARPHGPMTDRSGCSDV
jgi:hypothetical protein